MPFLLFAAAVSLPFLVYEIAAAQVLWSGDVEGSLSGIFTPGLQMGVAIVKAFVAGLMLQCVVSYGVYAQLSGRPRDLRASLRGLRRFLPVLGVALLITIMAYGTIILIGVLLGAFLGVAGVFLGAIAGGVAGLAIFCVYYVAIQATIVERVGVAKSMARSAWLTRGSRWPVLGIALVVYAVPVILNWFLTNQVLPEVASFGEHRTLILVSGVVGVVFWVLQAIAPAVLYYELRKSKEGVGLDEILDVFV